MLEKNLGEKFKMPKVIIDYREKNSLVAAELVELGAEINFQELKVADYIVGDTAIERKTCSDFLSSMLNKRLLRQVEELKQYSKKLLIIEGIDEQELYNDLPEGINGNAIRGMLLHILLEASCPIIFTKNYEDTAKFIFLIAKRAEREKQNFSLRAKKKAKNKEEQKQFILEGFPGIGPATAKKLLKEFKTIKKIISADPEKLKKIIGKKADIFKLVG